ncbi:MAG: winged helix-turn-helix domain-containing protein [Rhizobacter sp.]
MKALISEAPKSFAFGPFQLMPDQQLLLEGDRTVRIGGRAFDLLTALVERHGQVVSKTELMSRVWPGLVVEETNLKVNIAAIRRLLGEGSGPPRYVATVVGTGYRFVADVRPAPARPPAHRPAASRRVGNLPPLARRVLGRDDVIQALLGDLAQARLVTLVGPGGVGKTTVALAVADHAATTFPGGAWFVDLARLDAPSGVAEAVEDTLRSGADAGAAPGRADRALGPREVLLVLDNCEHVIDAVALCAEQLLRRATHVKLLATSREPLCIRGERVRRLPGLGLPPLDLHLPAVEALAFPAVQLFAERAAEPSSGFRLDDSNAPHVAAICHRLDGHALAIERVARRVGPLGIAGTLDHLERRFHMFDGCHEGPSRHRTLTAAVDASYSLLSPNEQAIMRRLSTFPGAFSLESACAAGGEDGLDAADVVDDLARLVAKSLVLAEARDHEMHYRLTHVARAFATEKRIEHGARHPHEPRD